MPSSYLKSDEYVAYGVAGGTTDAQVQQSSILVDSYLKRPEGLVYATDTSGYPLYMKSLPPTSTFILTSPLVPGVSVPANVTGPLQTLKRGAVLVIDKGVAANAETVVVASANGGSVVFQSVRKPHDAGVQMDAGLFIEEAKHLPTGRMSTLLARVPVVQIYAADGKYVPSRRGRYPYSQDDMSAFLTMAQTMTGGTPVAEAINVDQIDFRPKTGEVWLPSGLYMLPYSDVNFTYLAGFSEDSVPSIIKQVVANIIQVQARSPLAGNIKMLRAGDTQIERFMATLIGGDEKTALEPYVAKAYA